MSMGIMPLSAVVMADNAINKRKVKSPPKKGAASLKAIRKAVRNARLKRGRNG